MNFAPPRDLCPLAVDHRHAAPWITYYEDGTQVHHLTHPALWRHIWVMFRGRRLRTAWWYLTHRTSRP